MLLREGRVAAAKVYQGSCCNLLEMVRPVTVNSRAYYACSECGFAYETREFAQECQDWCKAHHSCSLEITKHAANLKR